MAAMNPIWKQRAWTFWREWIKPLSISAILVISFRSAVADWNDVPSGSMKPTILEGDRIFVNKMAYDLRVPLTSLRLKEWDGPQRGDIVVCFSPYDGIRLVKRCIGVPGDCIECREGRLTINGQPLEYMDLEYMDLEYMDKESGNLPAGSLGQSSAYRYSQETLGGTDHLIMTHRRSGMGRAFGPATLGKDEYFMMGDNRDESFDSRYFGIVPRKSIVGQVKGIALSVNPNRTAIA